VRLVLDPPAEEAQAQPGAGLVQLPDRGREAPDADRIARETALRAEWELVKQKWK
jgi:hypothetical protein